MIYLFLKNCLTRFERVHLLIMKIDKTFFLNEIVQQITIRSEQHCETYSR